jgi:hypothetical protein
MRSAALAPVNLAARQMFFVGEADAVDVFIARHVGEDNLIAASSLQKSTILRAVPTSCVLPDDTLDVLHPACLSADSTFPYFL